MPLFIYTAWDENGVQHRGSVEAREAADARKKLRWRGLYVTALAVPGDSSVAGTLLSFLGLRKRERAA